MHCPEAEDWQILRELAYLQVSESILDRPFGPLSHGEQTKALLASLFLNENRFLLIDEPTNHLDADGRRSVSEYLNRKRGFIVVSHDRAFLDGCVDHILSINRADIEIQKGNFSSWWHNRQLQDSFELARNERLKKDIKRLKTAAERTSAWSDKVEKTKRSKNNSGLKPDTGYIGHKAAKMAQRSKSMENRRQAAVEEKSRLLKNLEETESLKLSPLPFYTSRFAELDTSPCYTETEPYATVSLYRRAGRSDRARRKKRQREIKSPEAHLRRAASVSRDPSQEQPAYCFLCPPGHGGVCAAV